MCLYTKIYKNKQISQRETGFLIYYSLILVNRLHTKALFLFQLTKEKNSKSFPPWEFFGLHF